MKKFIQLSLCVGLLGTAAVKASHHDSRSYFSKTKDFTTEAATGAGVAAGATFLATESGRKALKNVLLNDKTKEFNTKHGAIAGGAALATYLIKHFELHNYLRKLPVVGEPTANLVENHPVAVVTGVGLGVLILLNKFMDVAAKSTTA